MTADPDFEDLLDRLQADCGDLYAALGIPTPPPVPERACLGCGRDLSGQPERQRYCSQPCGDAYRHRKAYAERNFSREDRGPI